LAHTAQNTHDKRVGAVKDKIPFTLLTIYQVPAGVFHQTLCQNLALVNNNITWAKLIKRIENTATWHGGEHETQQSGSHNKFDTIRAHDGVNILHFHFPLIE
jgi:hypothetical protein